MIYFRDDKACILAKKFQTFAKSKGVQRTATVFNAFAPLVVLGLVFLGGRDVLKSQEQVAIAKVEEQRLRGEIDELSKARDTLAKQKSDLAVAKSSLQVEVLQLKGQVQELTTKVDENDPQVVIQKVEAQLGGRIRQWQSQTGRNSLSESLE